jgi:hypothetical protein
LLSIEVILHMIRSLRDRGPVFYPEKSNDLERSHSQIG